MAVDVEATSPAPPGDQVDVVVADRRLLPTALASGTAGLLARIPLHPLDTIKALQQTHGGTVWDLARRTPLSVLCRGLPLTACGSIPAGALYFCTYEYAKRSLQERQQVPAVPAHFLAGMAAETVSCVLWLPIDVVKERRQTDRLGRYRSDLDALRQVWARGPAALYRGYLATLASFGTDVASSALSQSASTDPGRAYNVQGPSRAYTSPATRSCAPVSSRCPGRRRRTRAPCWPVRLPAGRRPPP